MNTRIRPVSLRRSWLFLSGVDTQGHARALASEADALIICLEDGTPPHLRDAGRAGLASFFDACRAAGKVACVRINPLHAGGLLDLEPAMRAAPDALLLPKTESPAQIVELATRMQALASHETEIVPNVETAAGLVRTVAIASAHPRVTACLVASEDMTTSLRAERGRDGVELQYARARFLVECRAAGVVPIDCPYTFSDLDGLESETLLARRLGFSAKSAVAVDQVSHINRLFTPNAEEVRKAREIVVEFERAHAQVGRAQVDGNYLEVPIYLNAKRLIERHEAFAK